MGVNLRGQLTADLSPLIGHAGDCAKVTAATITGRTDAACTCAMMPGFVSAHPLPPLPQQVVTYAPCPACSPSGPCEGHWVSK
jgi:hypothetical protein